MQEIEAKMRVDDFAKVREALSRAGAKRKGEVIETNTFFDTDDRSLLNAKSGLRLRINRDINTRDESYVVTFKGPQAHSQVKSREEIEITVDSAEQATALLARLGYDRRLSFEKRRESWSLDNCKIELDEIEQIGKFVEIEGPDEATILQMRSRLGLADHALIKEPYIAMVERLRSRSGN
jgi:adenylate cyclase class 2